AARRAPSEGPDHRTATPAAGARQSVRAGESGNVLRRSRALAAPEASVRYRAGRGDRPAARCAAAERDLDHRRLQCRISCVSSALGVSRRKKPPGSLTGGFASFATPPPAQSFALRAGNPKRARLFDLSLLKIGQKHQTWECLENEAGQ